MKSAFCPEKLSVLTACLLPILVASQEFTKAQPRGDERLVKEFIDEEMIYPEKALEQSMEGVVIFDFIVKEQGQVKELSVREPVNPLLKEEASRIFRLLIWKPAQYRGQVVESKVSFEVPFSIRHYKKACRDRGYQRIDLPKLPIDSSGTVYVIRYTDKQPIPVFESKDMNLQRFMAENFIYPEEALRLSITGIVKINFIVEPHGHISNVMVLEHLGAGCSEEAIRLIKLLRWEPGMKDGKAVRVNLSMPVTFGLSTDGGYKVSPAAGQTTFQ